jgi:hypothetical protein
MRLIVIKPASDPQALSALLLKKSAAGQAGAHAISQSTLEQVKRLNPHVVDFQRIKAGTVLLLPDSPELNAKDSQSLAGNSFEDFAAHMSEGFDAVVKRVGASPATLDTERRAVDAILNIEAVRNQIQSDKLLQKQLDEANREFTDAQMNAKVASRQVKAMKEDMSVELKALRGMLK